MEIILVGRLGVARPGGVLAAGGLPGRFQLAVHKGGANVHEVQHGRLGLHNSAWREPTALRTTCSVLAWLGYVPLARLRPPDDFTHSFSFLLVVV